MRFARRLIAILLSVCLLPHQGWAVSRSTLPERPQTAAAKAAVPHLAAPMAPQAPPAFSAPGRAQSATAIAAAAQGTEAANEPAVAELAQDAAALTEALGRGDAAEEDRSESVGRPFDRSRAESSEAAVAEISVPTPSYSSLLGPGRHSPVYAARRDPVAASASRAAPPAASDGASWIANGYYARYVGWWLQPAAVALTALWLHKAAVAAGAGPASILLVAAAAAAVQWAPRAALNKLLGRPSGPSDGVPAAAAALVFGGLLSAALLVPMGTGLPSMLLVAATAAALASWTLVARHRALRAAPMTAEQRAKFLAVGLAGAAVAATALDVLGWLPLSTSWLATFVFSLALLVDFIFEGLRRLAPRSPDPARRRFAWLSATGLLAAGAGGAGVLAGVLGPAMDERIRHFRPERSYSTSYGFNWRQDRPRPTWEQLEQAVARLRGGLPPDEAIVQARVLNDGLGQLYRARDNDFLYEDEYTVPRKKSSSDGDLAIGPSRARWLADLVLDPQVVRSPSAAARELVLDSKRDALDFLFARAENSATIGKTLLERLSALKDYEESLFAPDPSYPKFAFTEQERLSLGLRTRYFRLVERSETQKMPPELRERFEKEASLYEDISTALRSWLSQSTMASEREQQLRLASARGEAVHTLGAEDAVRAAQYRRWPPDLRAALIDSARAHGLAPEMLGANLIGQIERQYTLREGLSVFAQRQDTSTSWGRRKAQVGLWLADRVPSGVVMPVHWNDFLGSMVLDGRNGLGWFQLRVANVRRFPGVWARLGVPDANALSNREISYRLFDPRFNAEAWAGILQGMAREVEALRVKARRGEKLDFSEYERESRDWTKPSEAKTYALLPELGSLGDQWWRMARFHPLLRDKAEFDLATVFTLTASGAFDAKPIKLGALEAEEDVKAAYDLLSSEDLVMARAARAALEDLAGRPAPVAPAADRARGYFRDREDFLKDLTKEARGDLRLLAREALRVHAEKTAQSGFWGRLGLASFVAAGVIEANPKVSRRAFLGLKR